MTESEKKEFEALLPVLDALVDLLVERQAIAHEIGIDAQSFNPMYDFSICPNQYEQFIN